MNISCLLFGHKYKIKEVTVKTNEGPINQIRAFCPKCGRYFKPKFENNK